MKSLIKLIRAHTPRIGKRLAGVGTAFIAVSFFIGEYFNLEINDPFIQDMQLLKEWFFGTGLFLTGGGIVSTSGDPDKIVKDEPNQPTNIDK